MGPLSARQGESSYCPSYSGEGLKIWRVAANVLRKQYQPVMRDDSLLWCWGSRSLQQQTESFEKLRRATDLRDFSEMA